MNIKLNTICFIILLFLLVGVATAAPQDNETLQQTIKQPDDDACPVSVDEKNTLKASSKNNEKLELSVNHTDKLEKSLVDTGKLEKTKILYNTLTKSAKLKISIKASDMKIHYKDGSIFKVTVKDSTKKALQKVKVKFAINGKTYTKTTDSKGKASLTLNLNSGKYTITTTFSGSSKFYAKTVKNTITVKSTIKSDNLAKFYKNKAAYYSTFYDKKGKLLKNTAIKFKLNGKSHTVKTNKKGVAKLAIDLKPGTYGISVINSKTSETSSHTITIKSLLETHDLTMKENDGSKFSVKVLNCYGKVSPNKIVTLKVNGKTYTPKSNSNGIATQVIDLPEGKYSITTEYEGIKNTNQITVNEGIKHASFSHITMIPDYVNVTVPYAFHNSAYTLKTGNDGIIKLPKKDVFTVHISETKHYLFSTIPIPGVDATILDYKTYLVPFDGSDVKSDYNKDNLKDDGILISKVTNYTQIEFKSTTQLNADLFGVTYDKHLDNVEIITYIQNDLIKSRILFFTSHFDELGLKSNLGKLYDKNSYEINFNNYNALTQNNADKIKFSNTGETVKYTDTGDRILGEIPKEDIITKFVVNNVEELEKSETITYGNSDLYRITRGFEVLQSFAIINKKVNREIVENWVSKSYGYLPKLGINNIYGMFLSGIQTCWLSDEIANTYAKELNVNWGRESTTTILAGINLDDTYIHILNADMGMKVTGSSDNIGLFKLFNSMNLPNIEEFVLKPAAERYSNTTMNSLNNILYSIASNNYSITQIGEMIYVFGENNSAIILNTTSGVSNIILSTSKTTYKGSSISTTDDCCSVCNLANDIVDYVKNTLNRFKSGISKVSDLFDKNHPLSMLTYYGIKTAMGALLDGVPKVALGLFNTMSMIQTAGVTYRTGIVDEKDWHKVMDTYTFTRAGYLQGKKVYNIPNKNGGYDYIEVSINKDLTLNRDDVKYISHGNTKKLTKKESYQYFSDEYWTPFSMPQKYWDKSWK